MAVWAWYRPPHLPTGILFRIPPELAAASPAGFPFSLLDLLTAAGIDPVRIHSASIFGGEWQPAAVLSGCLALAVPAVPPGAPAELAVNVSEDTGPPIAGGTVQPASAAPAVPGPPAHSAAVPAAQTEEQRLLYDRLESSWKNCVQMERQMTGLRQKLASMLNSLGKLDRDLTPEERLASDREDRDAWHDARRWIRDVSAKCHREIKSFDIGMTSAAGRRNVIEQYYEQVIAPRVPSAELDTIRRALETYRKDMTTLQAAMNAALQAAGQNGTQRAQRVLGTIRRKIKARRARMREAIGGTNIDRSVRRKS